MNELDLLEYHYFMMEEFFIRNANGMSYSETRIPGERNSIISDNYEKFDLIHEMFLDSEGYYDGL